MKIKLKPYNSKTDYPKYDVTIGKKTFKNVRANSEHDCSYCKHKLKCPFYIDESFNYTIQRNDCIKEKRFINSLLTAWISPMAFMLLLNMFRRFQPPLLFFVLDLIILYCVIVICTSIYHKCKLYNELIQIEQAQIKREENLSKLLQNPFYQKISDATKLIEKLKVLAESCDFNSSNENIQNCIYSLDEIIKNLNKNNKAYSRVSSLLNIELEEFYNILLQYSKFASANYVDSEIEKNLNTVVNNFTEHVELKKSEVLLGSSEEISKISFKASTDAFNQYLDIYSNK